MHDVQYHPDDAHDEDAQERIQHRTFLLLGDATGNDPGDYKWQDQFQQPAKRGKRVLWHAGREVELDEHGYQANRVARGAIPDEVAADADRAGQDFHVLGSTEGHVREPPERVHAHEPDISVEVGGLRRLARKHGQGIQGNSAICKQEGNQEIDADGHCKKHRNRYSDLSYFIHVFSPVRVHAQTLLVANNPIEHHMKALMAPMIIDTSINQIMARNTGSVMVPAPIMFNTYRKTPTPAHTRRPANADPKIVPTVPDFFSASDPRIAAKATGKIEASIARRYWNSIRFPR